jgi:prolyl oligopeptidase
VDEGSGVRGRAMASTTAVIRSRRRAKSSAARTNFTGLLPQGRHAAVGRRTGLRRQGKPAAFQNVGTTEDERFALLTISERGKGKKGNALFYRISRRGDKFTPIVAEIGDDSYGVIDNVGDKFLIRTDKNAPNGRVVLVDPKNPDEKNWKTFCRKEPSRCRAWAPPAASSSLTARTWRRARTCLVSTANSKTKSCCRARNSRRLRRSERRQVCVLHFTSFNFPPTIYKYDIATKKSTVFRTVEIPGFKPDDYETKQVFYNSKDGTRVPMFLVYKKGLKLDGNNPTLLYGYGGFNVVTAPGFSSLRMALLEQGVVYASATCAAAASTARSGTRPARS